MTKTIIEKHWFGKSDYIIVAKQDGGNPTVLTFTVSDSERRVQLPKSPGDLMEYLHFMREAYMFLGIDYDAIIRRVLYKETGNVD